MKIVLMSAVMIAVASAAQATTWVVDPAASKIGFSGKQTGQTFEGHFKTFSGQIVFDTTQPQAGSADITVDTESAVTGDSQRDTALPQPEWFAVSKFPQARFVATGFTSRGGEAFEARGTLSVRGISAEVTLPFKLTISGDTAHAFGHTQLVRTTFGVGSGSWADPDVVALEVGVDIDVVAHKAP